MWREPQHLSQVIPSIHSLTRSLLFHPTPTPRQHLRASRCFSSISLLLWFSPSPPASRTRVPLSLGPPSPDYNPQAPPAPALRMPLAPRPLQVPPSRSSSLPPSAPLPRASAPASLHPSLCRSRIATAAPAEPSPAQAPAPARPLALGPPPPAPPPPAVLPRRLRCPPRRPQTPASSTEAGGRGGGAVAG